MKNKEQYIRIKEISVSKILFDFINNELLKGINLKKDKFWEGFNRATNELVPKNKIILETREKLEKSIDSFHLERKNNKLNLKSYKKFLKKIGYLNKPGPNFKIMTKNVDDEISSICGPQLVCPISNARFILNAANARWASLYDSLYGTDIIPETHGA